ncbi:MAG: NusA-like transcription termination signal-binding factor [Candidatus Bathyarchaeota archaeon]|jgi:N utilization substance protein A|nr:NusA-like transcription termination signal-binding factor [Candidatus Bathyarchaeota archaeon]
MQSQRIRLKGDEMRLIALFESITGATSKDCLIDEENDRVILVTKKGEMGLAIGKAGRNIDTLRRMTGRQIEVVEAADEPEQLIRNSLAPARVRTVRITEKPDSKIAVVEVESRDKAIAIGKNGKTIDKTRLLAKRYFHIDHVIIA